MRLFLVRHGETAANVSGVFCGQSDVVLTDHGEAQGEQVAQWLAPVVFDDAVSSALQRAWRTARLILDGREQSARRDPRLNEMHFGHWEMRHHRALAQEDPLAWAAWLADWRQARPTGGESFAEFSARVTSVALELLAGKPAGNVLLAAHQGVLSLIMALLLTLPAEGMWHFRFQQGAYSVLDIHDGFATLRAFNCRSSWESLT